MVEHSCKLHGELSEQKVLDDIEKYGCHILQIMAEGEQPPFSYSIGIIKNLGKPKVIVVGLKEPIAKFLVNEYNRRLKEGEDFYDDVEPRPLNPSYMFNVGWMGRASPNTCLLGESSKKMHLTQLKLT